MKKSYILVMTGLFLFITQVAKTQEKIKTEIKSGEKFPKINVINRLPESANLTNFESGYSNGLMIVDFWATWCVPCIRELTELSKLSARFKNRLKVVSVTHESAEMARAFFKKHPEIDLTNISILTSDKSLISYFPHRVLPHNVWIDSTGTVSAITSSEDITEKKISLFIQNKKPILREKKDILNFDYYKPYHAPDSLSILRSSLSRFNSGIPAGGTFKGATATDPGIRFIGGNYPIGMLYWSVYYRKINASPLINLHLVEFKTKDSLLMMMPKDISKTRYKTKTEWAEDNCYSYELSCARTISEDRFFERMKSDLVEQFGYKSELKSRLKIGQVIKLSDKANKIPKSAGKEKSFKLTAGGISMSNMTILELIGGINQFFNVAEPLIDETGLGYPIDLELKNHNSKEGLNMVKIIKLMEENGFQVRRQKRKVKVLVISDQN